MKTIISVVIILFSVLQTSLALEPDDGEKNVKVTFVEIGSVKCIACRKMAAVLDSIRQKYPNDVKVIFYDVWNEKGKSQARKYGINLIPSQIFLDENGREYFRHTGYFSLKEVSKILMQKGVKR